MTIQSKIQNLNDRGQAFVEFALILPLLLLLVFGITEFGRYLYLKNTATQGVRGGARVAAVTQNWNNKAAIFHATTSMIHGPFITVSVTSTPHDPPQTGDTVTVTIEKQFTSVISGDLPTDTSFTSFFSFSNLPHIRAQAQMRYE